MIMRSGLALLWRLLRFYQGAGKEYYDKHLWQYKQQWQWQLHPEHKLLFPHSFMNPSPLCTLPHIALWHSKSPTQARRPCWEQLYWMYATSLGHLKRSLSWNSQVWLDQSLQDRHHYSLYVLEMYPRHVQMTDQYSPAHSKTTFVPVLR